MQVATTTTKTKVTKVIAKP